MIFIRTKYSIWFCTSDTKMKCISYQPYPSRHTIYIWGPCGWLGHVDDASTMEWCQIIIGGSIIRSNVDGKNKLLENVSYFEL